MTVGTSTAVKLRWFRFRRLLLTCSLFDVNTTDTVEVVKPITRRTTYLRTRYTETKMSSFTGFAGSQDLPMKTAEIFRNNDGQYSFMCFHCGFIFQDFVEIINHCESHYREEKYNVSLQPSEFVICAVDGSELTQSLCSPKTETTSIEPTIFEPTSIESTSFTTTSQVPVRRRKKKRSKMSDFPQNCPICDNFRDHMKKVHDFHHSIYQCFLCSDFFKNFSSLRNHMSSRHTGHTANKCYHCAMEPPIQHASEPRRHKCLFCKEWFPNHIEFKIHFKNVHDKDADTFFNRRSNCNIFTCYVCEREFPLRYYLAEHIKIHYDKFLRHQCPTCGKRVRTFGQLTQHLKTHEGKIFYCDQCDKTFPYFARLRLHRFTHVTELNFKCELCPKAFIQRKYLTLHKAVHTQEKKYPCKFCNVTFNFTSGRRAHEKSQHKVL